MNTTYLIDLENIGTNPLCRHAEMHQNDEYIIFYSDNTLMPGSVLEKLPDMVHATFVNCKTGGNNAMDFCICAMAGKLSVHRTTKIKIISNDKGYDPMIHMLQEQGVRITREIAVCQPESRPANISAQPVNQKNKDNIIAVIRKNVSKKYQEDLIKVVLNAANRKEAYESCQVVLPNGIATDAYRKLRKYIPKETV